MKIRWCYGHREQMYVSHGKLCLDYRMTNLQITVLLLLNIVKVTRVILFKGGWNGII